jgi:DNA-3-methyladenine glycosylase I
MSLSRDDRERCGWASLTDPEYLAYHDLEWGVPVREERALFELLILEGAQAGLSWSTILHRRDSYRVAFANFEPDIVARFGADDEARLLADAGIIRNRAKVSAAIGNAQAWLALRDSATDPTEHLWSFVDGTPIQNTWHAMSDIPAETDISQAMSRDLRTRGFRFAGPTICYAFMQSVGMVNDHVTSCFRHAEVAALA